MKIEGPKLEGYLLAIKLLKEVPEDNGGITNCIHSIEWSRYLLKKLEELNDE